MRRMYDAAWPPASPPEWEVAAGYIGGNTPHVWTDPEWARQVARWRLPIFTRSWGGAPLEDAAAVIAWLTAHQVPKGVVVALDYETRVDPAYLQAFDAAVVRAGWRVMVYGSLSTVLRNPRPSGGYWVADWPGPGETATPHLVAGSAATQWSGSGPFGGAYDPSLVADSTPLWDTKGDDMLTDRQAQQLEDLHQLLLTTDGAGKPIDTASLALRRLKDGVTVKQDTAYNLADVTARLARLEAKVDAALMGTPALELEGTIELHPKPPTVAPAPLPAPPAG